MSEPIGINYIDYTGKSRRYFPDFLFTYKDNDNNKKTILVEVKPYKETNAPKSTKRKKKSTLIKEQQTWETNKRK
jgi:hypothetical protein